MASTPTFEYLTYEQIDAGCIARIMLNRPDVRNAQNRGLLVELNDAFMHAEMDDAVRVVILGAHGPSFSSGHDRGTPEDQRERAPGPTQHPTRQINGATRTGAENRILQEWHYFYDNTRRWRNLRKITIAQVQGKVHTAGLMLAWACDLIVASEDVDFADLAGAKYGLTGTEYFAHPFEFGPRLAKELLLTGDSIGAEEAHRLGMVSKVFSPDRLTEATLAFARRVAERPSMTALLIKDAVNQSVDQMGFQSALDAAFSIHQLSHAHWAWSSGGTAIAAEPTGPAP